MTSTGSLSKGGAKNWIFERFSRTPHVESTEQEIHEACHHLIAGRAQRDEGVVKCLREQIALLEKFKSKFLEATETTDAIERGG